MDLLKENRVILRAILTLIFLPSAQAEVLSKEWRAGLCHGPQKEYRAMVTARATEAPERNGWELSAYLGDTPDLITCPYYATVDVENKKGILKVFRFENQASCKQALASLKEATPKTPVVIVIDRNCVARLAH